MTPKGHFEINWPLEFECSLSFLFLKNFMAVNKEVFWEYLVWNCLASRILNCLNLKIQSHIFIGNSVFSQKCMQYFIIYLVQHWVQFSQNLSKYLYSSQFFLSLLLKNYVMFSNMNWLTVIDSLSFYVLFSEISNKRPQKTFSPNTYT